MREEVAVRSHTKKTPRSQRARRLKNYVFSIEDRAVFAAEFINLAGAIGFAFDGAGLAKAYAAGHHLFHTDLAGDFFIAGELGDSRKHRARAAGVDNRLSGIETDSCSAKASPKCKR